jgi:hypothetical protein
LDDLINGAIKYYGGTDGRTSEFLARAYELGRIAVLSQLTAKDKEIDKLRTDNINLQCAYDGRISLTNFLRNKISVKNKQIAELGARNEKLKVDRRGIRAELDKIPKWWRGLYMDKENRNGE